MKGRTGKMILRWLGKAVKTVALRHLDTNRDGRIQAKEVMTWFWDMVLEPELRDDPRFDLTSAPRA